MTRVLVAYATKHHSTAEIAEAIAEELRASGLEATAVDVGDAHAEGYDAVVLGSAVYMGRWRHEAKKFLKREHARLSTLPFWIFSTGPLAGTDADPSTDDKWLEPASVIELAEKAAVREHVVFGGRVPPDPGGFVERSMARSTPVELQDNRDWDQIRHWAHGIATALSDDRLVP